MSRHATWLAGPLWVAAAACSSADTTHPPGVSTDCTENCDPGYGSISAGGAKRPPKTDAGSATTDAGSGTTACGSDCVTDPNFGVSLCSRSLVCPGVVVDRTNPALQNCGFVDLRGVCSVADVECLCNGAFLCPITTFANCATLPGLLSQQLDVCGAAIAANRCLALDTVPRQDAGGCSPDCLRTCANMPICPTLCNC